MSFILIIALAAAVNIGELSSRSDDCVMNWTDKLEPAKESGSDTVEAAMQACLVERSDLKIALDEQPYPGLSREAVRRVSQQTFELNEGTVRKRALLRIIKKRAGLAQD